MPGLALILLASCAAQVPNTRKPIDDTPFHDAVAEWDADAARYAPAPAPRPRWTASAVDLPPMPLRAFSPAEAERIRAFQPIVYAAANTHAVAPDLVNGIIWVESRFKVRARSHRAACGLMQLLPRTGREVARNIGRPYEPFDPDFNIHAGTYYFAQMLQRFDGNMTLALAAYNIGPGVVDDWVRNSSPLPAGSRAYVDNVFEAARAFRSREL